MKDRVVLRPLKRWRRVRVIKFVLVIAWVGAIVYGVIISGGYRTIDLLYMIDSGVSVDSAQQWLTRIGRWYS